MTPNPIEAILGPSLVQILGSGLLDSLWQVAVVAAGVAAAMRLLRGSAAAARYAVAYSGLLLMLVLPVTTTGLRGWAPACIASIGAMATLPARLVPSTSVAALLPWLVCVWFVGVAALSLRLFGGWGVLRQMQAAGGRSLSEEWQETVARLSRRLQVSRPVSVVQSALVEVPGVVGWLRPVVFLPMSALTGLGPQHLEAILAHELAHVRRHDYGMNLAQTAIETLLFYHPAVWWLSRRVRVERENCCDDLAVSACGDPVEYACALTELERLRSLRWQPALAASGGHLLSRVRRLTAAAAVSQAQIPAWVVGAISFLTLAVITLAVQPGFAVPVFQPGAAGGAGLLSVAPDPLSALPTTLAAGTLLGMLLGMRHAVEPDHLVAISTLMTEERSASRAAWLGASWGVGHTVALVAVGAALAIVQANMPHRMTEVFDVGVAIMLVVLGVRALRAALQQGLNGSNVTHAHGALLHRHRGAIDHVHIGCWTLARRPLLVGVVHGLAGSGALTALAMASLPSASARVAYIMVFGLGSTLSMMLLSGCAGWPVARLARRPVALAALSGVTGCISITLGLTLGYPLISGWMF